MSVDKLVELAEAFILNNSEPFLFSIRPYGGSAYLIDEEGYYGPHSIPDYVVPSSFSQEEYDFLDDLLNESGLSIESISDDELESFIENIDLEDWGEMEIEPFELVEMVKAGCLPDTLYIGPPDFEYTDFFEMLQEEMSATYPHVSWASLDENEIDNWIEMLKKRLLDANEGIC